MTAEVAIMNRQALVFAADSATTVTSWVKGEREIRYFKGANKLFQLSNVHPVGLMIFGSAALHSVPWEIIVKDFRTSLDGASCELLARYADRFFEYVKNHAGLFPEDLRRKQFTDYVIMAAYLHAQMVKDNKGVTEAGEAEKLAKYREQFDQLAAMITEWEIPEPVKAEDIESAVVAYQAEIEKRIREEIGPEEILDIEVILRLADISIRAVMKRYETFLPETGLVIGGYGDKDYFPSFEVFKCFGFLDRLFILVRTDESSAVDREKPSVVAPFATKSMINTFRLGISPDVHKNVNEATEKCLRDFGGKVAAKLGHNGAVPDMEQLVTEALEGHQKQWFSPSFSDHYGPMARVIGSLPVAEMAALAKSLIELQSLKERVTQPSESVGGPIDVAVISKHDGFVWIERKHYFRPELNPRFFANHYPTGSN